MSSWQAINSVKCVGMTSPVVITCWIFPTRHWKQYSMLSLRPASYTFLLFMITYSSRLAFSFRLRSHIRPTHRYSPYLGGGKVSGSAFGTFKGRSNNLGDTDGLDEDPVLVRLAADDSKVDKFWIPKLKELPTHVKGFFQFLSNKSPLGFDPGSGSESKQKVTQNCLLCCHELIRLMYKNLNLNTLKLKSTAFSTKHSFSWIINIWSNVAEFWYHILWLLWGR
jgi:hypothetical protein